METEETWKARARREAAEGPQPGEVYRHYKGKICVIVARALTPENAESLVVYRGNANGITWAVPLADFEAEVSVDGYTGRRFVRVPD